MPYSIIDRALWAGVQKQFNVFRRKRLNLPTTALERLAFWCVPYIHSLSPHIVSPPRDWPIMFMSQKPSEKLMSFINLQDRRLIIYIEFGSIVVPDPEALSRVVIEAVLKADKDYPSIDILKKYHGRILSFSSIPHNWLFPKIQGVIHHGGVGTTAAGLRAGLPTVIKPFFGDQRFWGQRVKELGVGVCITKLTVNKLYDALMKISSSLCIISKAKENSAEFAVQCIYREMKMAKRNS
ncbi:hypothetical protein BDF14DRAFT_1876648 [Spinellus fusiger]|nr:hypothetical protein BDF14DRAFT_1876648 [Spinellus fusiger]